MYVTQEYLEKYIKNMHPSRWVRILSPNLPVKNIPQSWQIRNWSVVTFNVTFNVIFL